MPRIPPFAQRDKRQWQLKQTLHNERAVGAFIIVEMLYSSSLLEIVGSGEQPSLSPRLLCLFNTTTGTTLRELNFSTSVLTVRLNKKRSWIQIANCFSISNSRG